MAVYILGSRTPTINSPSNYSAFKVSSDITVLFERDIGTRDVRKGNKVFQSIRKRTLKNQC